MGTHVRERERHVREFVMVDQSRLRERIEATIEAMIAMLDELEGDPDLEPDTDEEPGADDEPSLAALEPSGIAYSWPRGLKTPGWGWYAPLGNASQEHWAQGDTHHGADLEEEHDGIEPDADEEPALGWADGEVQAERYAPTMGQP
ncbi:hypothetical protein [Xanthobacter sp. KR7-225]|uniref:hypothetical protein n=1 Tax=Xanthobacter sp. KR7-225 TaxID=3156613 RepID=UPI0032B3DB32